jgi:hypothetical protein
MAYRNLKKNAITRQYPEKSRPPYSAPLVKSNGAVACGIEKNSSRKLGRSIVRDGIAKGARMVRAALVMQKNAAERAKALHVTTMGIRNEGGF